MAYFRQRPNGSWEIRESIRTEDGPRSRTLVTFRELSPEVIDRAVSRSTRGLTADELRNAATEAGAPTAPSEADRAARLLLSELAKGNRPRLPLAKVLEHRLREAITGEQRVDQDPVTERELGDRLIQVLDLAEALPYQPRRALGARPLRDLIKADRG